MSTMGYPKNEDIRMSGVDIYVKWQWKLSHMLIVLYGHKLSETQSLVVYSLHHIWLSVFNLWHVSLHLFNCLSISKYLSRCYFSGRSVIYSVVVLFSSLVQILCSVRQIGCGYGHPRHLRQFFLPRRYFNAWSVRPNLSPCLHWYPFL